MRPQGYIEAKGWRSAAQSLRTQRSQTSEQEQPYKWKHDRHIMALLVRSHFGSRDEIPLLLSQSHSFGIARQSVLTGVTQTRYQQQNNNRKVDKRQFASVQRGQEDNK